MPARDPALRRQIAAAGGAARQRRSDADERRAALAVARLEAHIERVVAAAPPLTPAQRDRLAGLLRPAPAADSAADIAPAAVAS